MVSENPVDEAKPEKEETIDVRILGQAGESMEFRIKKTTAFDKLFKLFAERFGKSLNHLKFHIGDVRIQGTQNAKDVGLESGDDIDAYASQIGGNSRS